MPLVSAPPAVRVAPDLPPYGTAVPVVVPAARGHAARALPEPGSWVKLKLAGVQLHEGQLALVAGSCSRFATSTRDAPFDAAWAARLARGETAVWATRSVARAAPRYRGLPLVTVREVLQRARVEACGGGAGGGPFRLLARVVGHRPADARGFCRCLPGRDPGRRASWAYAAALQLEDATGRLDALLLGREAGEALLGAPACDLAADGAAAAAVAAALARLAHCDPGGVGADGEGCAWVEAVLTAVPRAAAAAAGAEAEAAARAQLQQGLGGDGGGATGVSAEAAAALAAADSVVFVLHDTHLCA